jgi:hypothetical protein
MAYVIIAPIATSGVRTAAEIVIGVKQEVFWLAVMDDQFLCND